MQADDLDLLVPGQAYAKAFVTSEQFNVVTSNQYPPGPGEFGSLTNADYQTTFAAYNAGLIPNWDGIESDDYQAILRDGVTNAANRLLNNGGPVFNMTGQLVAGSSNMLFDGELINPIDYDENGNLVPPDTQVFTGSYANGTSTPFTANRWLNPNAPAATFGLAGATNGTWLNAGTVPANESLSFYGISAYTPSFAPTQPQSVTVPVGNNQLASVGGGAHIASGVQIEFGNIAAQGNLTNGTMVTFPTFLSLNTAHGVNSTLATAIGTAAYNAIDFPLAGDFFHGGQFPTGVLSGLYGDIQLWNLQFTGAFTGSANVTLSYSPLLLGDSSPQSLTVWHFADGAWTQVSNQYLDTANHDITFSTTDLGYFILGVPEPGTFALAAIALGGLAAFGRRRRVAHVVCVVAIGVTLAARADAVTYNVTDIGLLPGFVSSTATSVDNSGEVVGYDTAASGNIKAFYRTQSGGLVGLGGIFSKALGVNNGNVVGTAGTLPGTESSGGRMS